MKNFFGKGNPFVESDDKKGDKMTDETQNIEENNEQNIIEPEEKDETASQENKDENSEVASADDENTKLKKDLEEKNNQYLRLAADFDNYRKRQAQEREELLKFGATECMKKIIEVVDNFDRALQSVEKIDNVDKMKETFYVLNKQLTDSLTKLGLQHIECVGEKFDPNLHEAVMRTQTEEYPEDTIIKELQKGYKMGDKVLRPSLVDVAVK